MTRSDPHAVPGTGWAAAVLRSLLLAILVLIGLVGTARAHAVVTGSEPPDGAVLGAPPSEVVVHFNEPVALARAQVLDPAGTDILSPETAQAGEDGLRLPLPSGLDEGVYTVSYHVVSLDGHPIAGSVVFRVGLGSTGAGSAEAEDWTAFWRQAFVAVHVVLYLGLFGAVGGVAFGLLMRSGARETALSAPVGVLAAGAALGMQGALLLGGPPSVLFEADTWAAGLGSTFGRTALCAITGLLMIEMGHRLRSRQGREGLMIVGAILALASLGLSGHVVTAGPRALTLPPLLVHAVVAAFWIGSLVPLLRALAAPGEATPTVLQGFSRLAVLGVPVLVAAGLVLAWIQVRTPGALVATSYGRVLLAKLVLVGALLGLAGLNRLILTPALARGAPSAARRLARSIRAEVGLVVLILAATATLGATPPPRALLGGSGPTDAHAHAEHGIQHLGPRLTVMADGFMAEVLLTPGEVGSNDATISVTDHAGEPLSVLDVALRLSNPEKGIAPLEREAGETLPGEWQVADLPLAVSGTWVIEVDALISDFKRQAARGEIALP